jgi:hypothetical protein
MQLVVPATEPVDAEQAMPLVLYLSGMGCRPHHAKAKLPRAQAVAATGVVAETEHQGPGIGPIIGDEVRALPIRRGVHHLAQPDGHVLLVEPLWLQQRQTPIQRLHDPGQAGIVAVVDQIGGDPADQKTVRVAMVLADATEQIVVDAQIDRAGRAQRCPFRANRLTVMRLLGNGWPRQDHEP